MKLSRMKNLMTSKNIEGYVIKYERANIDTDLIIPARYLNVSEQKELGAHCMEDLDGDFLKKREKLDAKILVGGPNFGCGSSREHAPIALSHSGIKAILALSFARIFYRNAVDGAFLLPIEIDENAYQNISEGDEIDIDVSSNEIKNITKNQTYKMKPFSEIIGKIIKAGGLFKYKPD